MKKTLLLTLLALLLLSPAPARAKGKTYLAIERGQVLFLVDRNRWESAPNYLRLREGDALKVMPGTVGKITCEDGTEYHLPVAETVTIEADGIAWRRDGGKVHTRYKDGLYHTVVDEDDGREFPAAAVPRAIEIVPSEARLEERRKASDEAGDRLRARLALSRATVLEERRAPEPSRFRRGESGEERRDPSRIGRPEERMERTLLSSVDGSDRHAAWRKVEHARDRLDELAGEIDDLQTAIAAKESANLNALDEKKQLQETIRAARDRHERLARLARRDRLLRSIE